MENKHNVRTSSDTDPVCHSDGSSGQCLDQKVPPDITHSISPGVPCSETVLVAVMSNGGYLLVGYPQVGPTVLVMRDDAGPLRQALEGGFDGPTDEGASGNATGISNSTRTGAVLPGPKALHTTQARP